MSSDNGNPFLITPPPGLLPPARETPEEANPNTSGGDSATVRLSPPREPIAARPPAAQGIPFVAPTPPPTLAPPPASVEVVDNDETRVVPPRSEAPASWRLVMPDGSSATVTAALFIGRNPIRADGDVDGELLAVADTTKSVSKTHAVVEVVDGQLWVTDLNSTNGVFVVTDGQDDVHATPMQRTAVGAGSDIELGEFVIQVERG